MNKELSFEQMSKSAGDYSFLEMKGKNPQDALVRNYQTLIDFGYTFESIHIEENIDKCKLIMTDPLGKKDIKLWSQKNKQWF